MNLTRQRASNPFDSMPALPTFELSSASLSPGEAMPMLHVYSAAGGDNTSPHLAWSGFPADTQGFAVTCFDPDAPTLSGWWHWILVGLPADLTELPAGAGAADFQGLPDGALHLTNDYGTRDFGGAAPPPGDHYHRYYFTVYALDTADLGLGPDVSAAVAGFTINAHAIARAHLVVTFAH